MASILGKLGPRQPTLRAPGARVWYERALAAESSGDVAAARHAYHKALAANPDLADAASNLGRLHHEAGELADAEGWYRIALCMRALAVYWFNLGVALEDQHRRAEAIACYCAALDRDDRLADAHFN